MRDVYIVAVGMIPFGKYPDLQIKQLTAAAMRAPAGRQPAPGRSDRGGLDVELRVGDEHRPALHPGPGGPRPAGLRGHPGHERGERLRRRVLRVARRLPRAWPPGPTTSPWPWGPRSCRCPPDAGAEAKEAGFRSFIAGTDVEVTTKLIEELQAEAERKRAEAEASGVARFERSKGGRSEPLHGHLLHGGPGPHGALRHHPGAAGGDSGQEPPSTARSTPTPSTAST